MMELIPSLKPAVIMKLLALADSSAKVDDEVSYEFKFIDHNYVPKYKSMRCDTVKVKGYTNNIDDIMGLISDRHSQQLIEVGCTIRSTDKDRNNSTIYRKYHIDIISATLEVSKFGDKNAWDLETLKAEGIELGWGSVREITLHP